MTDRYTGSVKFFLSILTYLIIAGVLGWGILMAVRGNLWLLVVAVLAYVVIFAKAGCLPPKGSH